MPRFPQHTWAALLTALLLGKVSLASPALPFQKGESLNYEARIGRMGKGKGTLRVKEAPELRGEAVLLLEMAVEVRMGPLRMNHHSQSWLSPERMATLRYQVKERTPVGRIDEEFEIHPEGCHFEGKKLSGQCGSSKPLDELSYIYFLRTLELEKGSELSLSRHFNPARNPAELEVQGKERITVPAGEFDTTVMRFKVIDPDRLGGSGEMRLYFSDDSRRIPVRIESKVPFFGHMVLELLPRSREEK